MARVVLVSWLWFVSCSYHGYCRALVHFGRGGLGGF